MRKQVLFKTLLFLMSLLLLLSGFTGALEVRAAETVPVTSIKLNIQSCTIDVASVVKFTAAVQPANASDKEVIWQTDNPSIARVTNGTLRGYAEGTTVIKASTRDQGRATYCIVTVKKSLAPVPIINVRADDDKNGKPDFIISTAPFTIEGRVSADFRAISNNIPAGKIYIQDSTAGIAVYGVTKELKLGARVRLTGTVAYSYGETQFLAAYVEVVNSAVEEVKAAAVSTGDSMLESREGLLVKVQGKITKTLQGIIYVNDSTNPKNEAKVIIGNYLTINSTPEALTAEIPPALKIGNTVSITGIASQDEDGHKIIIRNAKDLRILTNENKEEEEKSKSIVGINKHSIVIKTGKFQHVSILTKPGNAVITSVRIKTNSPIVTISQDKKNKRLLRITPIKNIKEASQKLEIEVVVNGKAYTLTLDVKIAGTKPKPSGKWNK